MAVSLARKAAFAILLKVEERGAFVDELLHGGRLEDLAERDRALASEIVLGTLRRWGAIDWMLEKPARKGVAELDAEVRTALRMGAYQLRYLDRIPPHAAVGESVELVKRGPRAKAAGFVNAVLRRAGPLPDESREAELNHPAWLVERWERNLGPEAARALMRVNLERPETWLRLNKQFDLDETVARLQSEGVESEPAETPWTRRLISGRPEHTSAWREGRLRIQDAGSQAIVPLLGLEPGMTLADVCAAPGGKTQHAIEILGSANGVVACDLYPARLRLMRELGFYEPALVALDAARPLPFRRAFDRVLVDAPCSGTGTLGRNPDLKWRLAPGDIARMAERQAAILNQALDAVTPGGALVYATCSLEPEENEGVVEAVLASRPEWRIIERLERTPRRDAGDGFRASKLARK
jgi:16S rRNA (cytosine967-C5)-methyltransferase